MSHAKKNPNTTHLRFFSNFPPEVKMMVYGYTSAAIKQFTSIEPKSHAPALSEPALCKHREFKRWTKPVVVEKANQLVHTVCSKSVSEEAEQQVFGSPSAAWKNVSNKSPHRHCVSKDLANTIFVRGWAKPAIQLDFSFLRSCRQIYDEAELVPYKTSVFSFEESEALRSSRH